MDPASQKMKFARAFVAVSFIAAYLILVVTGCGDGGPQLYKAQGQVIFNKQPLPAGDILFIPVDSKRGPSAGKVVNGAYNIEASAGPNRVEIRAMRDVPGGKEVLGSKPQENYLHARYHAQSTLKAEVSASGSNEFNFELMP